MLFFSRNVQLFRLFIDLGVFDKRLCIGVTSPARPACSSLSDRRRSSQTAAASRWWRALPCACKPPKQTLSAHSRGGAGGECVDALDVGQLREEERQHVLRQVHVHRALVDLAQHCARNEVSVPARSRVGGVAHRPLTRSPARPSSIAFCRSCARTALAVAAREADAERSGAFTRRRSHRSAANGRSRRSRAAAARRSTCRRCPRPPRRTTSTRTAAR